MLDFILQAVKDDKAAVRERGSSRLIQARDRDGRRRAGAGRWSKLIDDTFTALS